MKTKQNIAIFASYNASSLDSLYTSCKSDELNASIKLVITNNTDANVLNKAKNYAINSYVINTSNTKNVDERILMLLKEYNIDYIILMGYMKRISKSITEQYKIINTHPSLLPAYGGAGMYGKYVHEAVIKNNEKISGVTVHYVNENYDDGKIILQEKLVLNENESVESLENKIKQLEQVTLVKALKICLK